MTREEYTDKFAVDLCRIAEGRVTGEPVKGIDLYARQYIKERTDELRKQLWEETYNEFNNLKCFPELNNLMPVRTKIDCIDFTSDIFSTTEKMQMLYRGYADFLSLRQKEAFESDVWSLISGRVTGLGCYASWIMDLDAERWPKPTHARRRWYEEEVCKLLYTGDDWNTILKKIESYASCDTMGSEKVAKRKEGEPDNLQTRMERWERVNFRLMRELSQDEWVRVVNNIGSMTESEAEDLYYSFQHKL